jgi:NAD(P)-dependent dehydrogenase (short-subunit alcohol dehydrogenase family)
MLFEGKTVVITGAGSGIGRGLAIGFSRDAADVVGIGRTRRDLEETAAHCGPGTMHYVVGDVAREADVERLFGEAFERHRRVDVLVNNAALYPNRAFLECSHDEWARAIETNLIGLALCCRKALPGMLERGHGRILNLGSFAWKRPIPGSSAYAASKAAVRAFTKALAAEIDRERYPDVLINEFLPGVYRTRMSEVGEDPSEAYRHARFVASLPANGPHGEAFVRSELFVEEQEGLRGRLRRLVSRAMGARIAP